MSNVNIEKVRKDQSESVSVFQAINRLSERIQTRAYEIFLKRGGEHGSDIADWHEAEGEGIFGVDAELLINKGKIELQLAVPGFRADQLQIIACPHVLTVFGDAVYSNENLHFCELGGGTFFRRFSMPTPINGEDLTATLERGILRITFAAAGRERAARTMAAAAH